MSLPPVAGHEELRRLLADAATSGRLPQSVLFRGAPGIGKQRLALWLAAVLQCERHTGCGECRSCRLAAELQHPDIHWYFPLERPKRVTANKLREKLEEARLAELDARRAEPLRRLAEDAPTGLHLGTIENLRERAIRRPAMGPRTVFIVGRAEQMVSQQASQEAANAFLKLLEEPPEDVHIFLTSSRPGALLPTVRSRVLSIRVLPLAAEEVADYLQAEADIGRERAHRIARLAQGSIGRALQIAGGEEDGYDDAERLLRVALGGNRAERLRYSLSLSARGARGGFLRALEATGELMRDQLALATGNADDALDIERARRLSPERPRAEAILAGLQSLEHAKLAAAGNVNPQAVSASLLGELAAALSTDRSGTDAGYAERDATHRKVRRP
jgi:DNA polymerase-3 subunit delta'